MTHRVFVITPDLTRTAGGMRTSVPSLWRAAARHGVDVRFYAPANAHFAEDTRGWSGPPLWSAPISGPKRFGWVPGMVEAIAEEARGAGVLSLHGLWMGTGLAASKLRKREKLPLIVHPHGMLEPWALARSPVRKAMVRTWFEGGNLRDTACLRALNVEEARQFRAIGLMAPIAVIPNGAEPPSPLPAPPEAESEFPILRGRRVMLFMSRLHPKKGLPLLLSAWKDAAPREWLLAIAGPDFAGHRAELEAQAASLGISETIAFLGELGIEAKWRVLARADAFVLPSHGEGFSMAILEAAAAGRPVILTRGCHFPELAQAGGGIETEATEAALAKTLREMTAMSDTDRAAMGAAGRALVLAKYGWDGIGAKMADVCRWIAGGGTEPDCIWRGDSRA